MADIFISKSTKDHWLASSLCEKLEKNGISCWIAPRDLQTKAGGLYADDIVEGIENAKAFILILSRDSNKSEHCMNEVTTACDKKKKVFVLQIDELKDINKTFIYYTSQQQWIQDFKVKRDGNFENTIKKIAEFFQIIVQNDKNAFVDKDYQQIINMQELAKNTIEKRQALFLSIYNEKEVEEESDDAHIYKHLIRLDIVDSEKNEWSSYRFLTLKNVSDKPTMYIVHKEVGESKATFNEMKIRAKVGNMLGEKLRVESLTEIQPNVKQVFRIYFPKPLFPNEEVTVCYRIDWPNEPMAYYMKDLMQSVSLIRYKKGVEKLTFAVYEPYKIISSYLNEVDQMNVKKTTNYRPLYMEMTEDELLQPLLKKYNDGKYNGIKYIIENPTSKAYIIKYSKEKIEDVEDEDDFF